MWHTIIRRTYWMMLRQSEKKKKLSPCLTQVGRPDDAFKHTQPVCSQVLSNILLIAQMCCHNLCIHNAIWGNIVWRRRYGAAASPPTFLLHPPPSPEQTPWIIQPVLTFNAPHNYSIPRFIIILSCLFFFSGWGIFISIALILNGSAHVIISTLPAGWRASRLCQPRSPFIS